VDVPETGRVEWWFTVTEAAVYEFKLKMTTRGELLPFLGTAT